MKVVISGSNGFLGRNLISILSDKEYTICPLDINTGVDLTKAEQLENIPTFDVFIHLANLSYVPDSYIKPELFYKNNFLTTLNSLELCRKNNAKLIYISSYIYGTPEYLPVDENHEINPFNPYAQTKLICENLCEGYFRDFSVKTTILRPFNIYGIGQKGQLLIPEIFQQLQKGCGKIYLRDGAPRRDYVNVIDVAQAIKSSIDFADKFDKYNVCSGKSYSVKEITEIINSYLTKPVDFIFGESDRPNEVNETLGTYKKIKDELKWSPSMSFEEGVKSLVKYNNL